MMLGVGARRTDPDGGGGAWGGGGKKINLCEPNNKTPTYIHFGRAQAPSIRVAQLPWHACMHMYSRRVWVVGEAGLAGICADAFLVGYRSANPGWGS